ncbi:MAG: NAD-binding protein [Candidatus Gastranaerophilales bacterium]|nr:NAD-binding protein [Candidatus Gastranaerophilales bacterium]
MMNKDYKPTFYHFLKPFLGLAVLICIGIVGYTNIEGWSVLDSFFMSVETLTTVGYGLNEPLTTQGKLFTIIYIIFGVFLFLYLASEFAQHVFMANFNKRFRVKSMENKIKKLKNHYLVCGFGRTGKEIVLQLQNNNIPFVVIEKDENLESVMEDMNILYLPGDATEDETLKNAGIDRAKGIFCTLSDDVDNLYLTVSAKNINPDLKIITRCVKTSNEQKFKNAGATQTILPYEISARRMVASVVKPLVVDFMDIVMHNQGKGLKLKLDQIYIKKGSPLENETVLSSKLKDKTGVTIVAIQRNEEFITNPPANTKFMAGDYLLAIGTNQELSKLQEII